LRPEIQSRTSCGKATGVWMPKIVDHDQQRRALLL
jgi:hypothetical protein